MRILIVSAPPWAATGYGQQIASLIPRLQKDGHTIGMLPLGGFHGGYASIDGVDYLPPVDLANKGCNDIIEAYAKVYNADIVFSLTDPWVLTNYGAGRFRWIPYCPIDGDPLNPNITKVLPAAWRIVAMSHHGQQKMLDEGFQSTLIPHGFEETVFYYSEKDRADFRRTMLGVDDDAFVFGSVGLNYSYPGRKGFDRLIDTFARFAEGKDNVYLYLHCDPRPNNSLDLELCVEQAGVRDKVIFAKPVSYAIGYNADAMRGLYNALDVYVQATHGEGFGIPVLEALACGVPVIATDCTSMPDLVQDTINGTLVKPVARYKNMAHYYQYLIDEDQLLVEMEGLYEKHFYVPQGMSGGMAGEMHGARFPSLKLICRMTVREFAWDQVYAQRWKPFFDDCQREIEAGSDIESSRSGAKLTILENGHVRKTDGPTANVKRGYDILKKLDHPNIIKPVADGIDEWGRFFYEMPQYPRSLDQAPLDTIDPERVCAGVRSALEYMHALGLAHRDVHESNILLTEDGDPILIDFGWADACPGSPCVDFEPWKVPERGTPNSQLGNLSGMHRIAAYVYGIDLRGSEATALAGVPYQAIAGAGERDPALRWDLLAPEVAGKTVLDIGCNLGYFAARSLTEGAVRAVGIDQDPVTIEAARKLYPDVEFRLGDLNNGGIPEDEHYDVAFALSVLQHLKDPDAALVRLLKVADTVYVEAPDETMARLPGPGTVLGRSERDRVLARF